MITFRDDSITPLQVLAQLITVSCAFAKKTKAKESKENNESIVYSQEMF